MASKLKKAIRQELIDKLNVIIQECDNDKKEKQTA